MGWCMCKCVPVFLHGEISLSFPQNFINTASSLTRRSPTTAFIPCCAVTKAGGAASAWRAGGRMRCSRAEDSALLVLTARTEVIQRLGNEIQRKMSLCQDAFLVHVPQLQRGWSRERRRCAGCGLCWLTCGWVPVGVKEMRRNGAVHQRQDAGTVPKLHRTSIIFFVSESAWGRWPYSYHEQISVWHQTSVVITIFSTSLC